MVIFLTDYLLKIESKVGMFYEPCTQPNKCLGTAVI